MLINLAKLYGDVMVMPIALNSDECQQIIRICEEDTSGWRRSGTIDKVKNEGDYYCNGQSDSYFIMTTTESLSNIDNILFNAYSAGLAKYSELIGSEFYVTSDEGYSLMRYGIDDHYKPHVDKGPNQKRVISALIYLNEDYEGGELDFVRQKLIIKPTTGMLVMFPSGATHIHASLPIKSGGKYTAATWFY